MDRLRIPRFAGPLLVVALIVAASAAFGSWLPVLATFPWLAAIAWFGSRDTGAAREFPSAAEAARERLWD
jgi:4-hydroxybenzoate polyprenyltransferase